MDSAPRTVSLSDRARARSLFGNRAITRLAPHQYLIQGTAVKGQEAPVYTVDLTDGEGACTCPRFERRLGWRNQDCKHLAFFRELESVTGNT